MDKRLIVSVSPHIYSGETSARIMWVVFLSLLPAGYAGIAIFGWATLGVILVSIACAVLTEAIIQKLRGLKITVFDGSAALTGLLLAYCLPPTVPLWLAACGSFVAVAIGKQAFGGLGQNIFNPALVGRAFLLSSWSKQMSTYLLAGHALDGITGATPLTAPISYSYWDLFLGNRGGCIGEVAIFALLAGAIFLLICGYISWHIPGSFIATVAIFSWIFAADTLFSGDWLFQILSGGLILGAFFMATDYVTSPLTNKGKLIFGFGCGLFTFVIRHWGGYPEGVCYAILLMNAATPLIDRYTQPRRFGA